jgi:hypothetical protein
MLFLFCRFQLLSNVIALSDKENEPTHKPTRIRDKLSCSWNPTFESAANHKQACMAANDEYTVPYTCNGVHTFLRCTVSGIVNPTFLKDKFGTCLKNGATY